MATFPEVFKLVTQPRITSNVPVYSSESISLIQKKRKIPAQRWEFTVNVLANSQQNINKADAWIFSKNGSFETFTFNLDVNKKPENTPDTTNISGAKSKGSNSINVTPIPNLTVDDVGFYIRVSGDSKVYMVSEVIKGGSVDELVIFPALRSDAADNAIVYLDADFTVRLDDNITSGEYGNSRRLKNWNFKFVEAL